MLQERGTADIRAVDDGRAQAEIFSHGERWHEVRKRRREQAVDVLEFQTGVRESGVDGLGEELEMAEAGRVTASGKADADNGGRAVQRMRNVGHAGTNTIKGSLSAVLIWARTGIPIRTSVGGMPSTRLIIRAPSVRSIRATL